MLAALQGCALIDLDVNSTLVIWQFLGPLALEELGCVCPRWFALIVVRCFAATALDSHAIVASNQSGDRVLEDMFRRLRDDVLGICAAQAPVTCHLTAPWRVPMTCGRFEAGEHETEREHHHEDCSMVWPEFSLSVRSRCSPVDSARWHMTCTSWTSWSIA